jgi:hypothetical protein
MCNSECILLNTRHLQVLANIDGMETAPAPGMDDVGSILIVRMLMGEAGSVCLRGWVKSVWVAQG